MAKKCGDPAYSIWPPTDAALLLPFQLSAHQFKRILFWCWFHPVSWHFYSFSLFVSAFPRNKQIESAYLKKIKSFFFFLLLSPDLILVKIHSKSVDFNQIINVKQDLHIWSIMLFLLLMSGFSHPCTLSCSAIFFCMAFKSFECCVTWTKIRRHHTSVSVRTISPPASLAMTRLTKSGELSSLGRMVMGNLCLMFYLPSNILKTA